MVALNGISRISKDTVIYIPVFLTPALINIVLLMTFTRFFTPMQYGTYTIVVNTTIIISSLLAQWIVLSVQRYRPEYSRAGNIGEFNRNLNYLLLVITLVFLLVSSILYIFLPELLQSYQIYYWPSFLFVISSIYFMVFGGVYQVDLLAKHVRNFNVVQSVLKLVLTFLLIVLINFDPVSFIWGAFFAQVLVIVPMLRYVETDKMFSEIHRNMQSFLAFVKKLWTYGFPLIGWYIGTTILNLTDRYMIEYFRSSNEVGVYSANFTIAVQAVALICNPLFFAIQPLIMNEIQQNTSKAYIEERISLFTRIFIIITMPFGVYFSIYREEISEIILGDQFTSGAMIIPILIIGFFAWNIGLYGQLTYQIAERTKAMFYFILVAAVCNFGLNLLFIPKWGFIGAAISTSIGFIVYSCLLFICSYNHIKWKIPWVALMKVTLIALVLMVPIMLVNQYVSEDMIPLVRMIIGTPFFLFYIGLVIVFRENPLKQMRT